jgi:hypothetical protein
MSLFNLCFINLSLITELFMRSLKCYASVQFIRYGFGAPPASWNGPVLTVTPLQTTANPGKQVTFRFHLSEHGGIDIFAPRIQYDRRRLCLDGGTLVRGEGFTNLFFQLQLV